MADQCADQIRVLIVDDSAVARGVMGRIIDAEPDMRVVTTAINGRVALEALRQHAVDVVLLDIEMPIMDGLSALPLILANHPDVSVLITSSLTREGAAVTMRALALGAVDYIYKPSTRGVAGMEEATATLTSKVRAIARGRSRRMRAAGGVGAESGATSFAAAPVSAVVRGDFEPRILAIAASTGGPNALAAVIAGLPSDFSLPVVVTQHMPPIFTTMFAQRLARNSSLPCEEACAGQALQGGHVYVAPGGYHLTVRNAGAGNVPAISINQDPPEHHCRPAADPMFRSVARVYGSGALAVVLTGMGSDGRLGCEAIARAGGRVIVQDEATSVVWGMPGNIVNSGIPCTMLPLHSVAAHVTSLCCART